MHAFTVSMCSGLVIAEVSPEAIAIVRNALLMPSRFGKPKLTFDAPQVVFTFNSSRRRRTRRNTCCPAVPMAPIGMTRGSTTMSCGLMPKSAARSTIFLATAKRTSGSSEMPVSSLEMATTGTLYFAMRGRMASSFSSSPVTEFTSGRPLAVSKPIFKAEVTEESMHKGRSTSDCTISSVCFISGGSVSLGFTAVTPALMSRIWAPAAT